MFVFNILGFFSFPSQDSHLPLSVAICSIIFHLSATFRMSFNSAIKSGVFRVVIPLSCYKRLPEGSPVTTNSDCYSKEVLALFIRWRPKLSRTKIDKRSMCHYPATEEIYLHIPAFLHLNTPVSGSMYVSILCLGTNSTGLDASDSLK